MAEDRDVKLDQAIDDLKKALKYKEKALKDSFFFGGIVKAFEVCLEYAWKYFKRRAIDEGIEVYSPKEAVKAAGRLGIIDNVEEWLEFVNTRNLSVHDYLSIPDQDYLEIIAKFLQSLKAIQ